jgi:photosystem II stability/assembly factor-like uncharacterized protein
MANATIIYACTNDGLIIANKPGTLPEWLPAHVVLPGRPVSSVWAEPGPPIRVLAVVEGEIQQSENGGRTWEPAALAEVVTSLFFTGEPPALYACMEGGGLATSLDGGATWGILPALPEAGVVRAFFEDGKTPDRYYALVAGEDDSVVLHGEPQSGDWRALPVEGAAVAQDPGLGDLYATTPDGVQMSADMGDTWALLPGSPPGGTAILAIASAGGRSAGLVVGAPTGLWIGAEGGSTWQPMALPKPGTPVALARDPERRDRLYAATDAGYLLESGNRGQAWQPVNSDPLPPAIYLYILRI